MFVALAGAGGASETSEESIGPLSVLLKQYLTFSARHAPAPAEANMAPGRPLWKKVLVVSGF
jgi:hypothetical protein